MSFTQRELEVFAKKNLFYNLAVEELKNSRNGELKVHLFPFPTPPFLLSELTGRRGLRLEMLKADFYNIVYVWSFFFFNKLKVHS